MSQFIIKNIVIPFIVLSLSINIIIAQSIITNPISTKKYASTIFQKMVDDNISTIEILTDFDKLLKNKRTLEEQKAELSLVNSNGAKMKMKIKVRTRGVYRRKFCDLPPLRLNFDDTDLDSLDLNPAYDKLKLVTHCMEEENSEQVLLREYWTYKLYNQITPNSFKVHLIKVVYINTKNKKEQLERLGFIIENNKELADRIGGKLVDKYGLTPSKTTADSYQNCSMFNYMIGNLDWHLQRKRNIKIVQLTNSNELVLVPYDFDMSALVWPSYARLNPDFNQKKFNDRYVVGKFQSEIGLKTTAKKFQELKVYYLTCFDKCPYLNENSKKKMKNFIQSFYKPLDKEKALKKKFL